MEEPVPLQEIIGVDKKNPFFTICKHPQQPGKLMVFFGAALLEIVDEDQENPAFKLLLARLYNARVKRETLQETFGVAISTLRRWGEALTGDDPERLVRVLAGRRHPRKLTPEILGFSKKRFSHIYPQNHYSYSKQIREEIQATFEVTISAETLRPYFAQWKPVRLDDTEPRAETPSEGCGEQEPCSDERAENQPEAGDPSSQPDQTEPALQEELAACAAPQTSPPKQSRVAAVRPQNAGEPELGEPVPGHLVAQQALSVASCEPNRKHVNAFATDPGYHFCHHAGILVFSAYLPIASVNVCSL
ncbi:MAG: hypothetical protein GY800_09860 [Planctomycetes bacterium]|nr:hypothetical protein [Planctomycetota bacterium]